MKKMIVKCTLLAILSLPTMLCISCVVTLLGGNLTGNASIVYTAIERAGQENDYRAVCIGDSVCNQLWQINEEDGKVFHLATNASITVCGNYLLLKEYLENNKQTETVYYIVCPQNLNIDASKSTDSFIYFVIPFCTRENLALLTPRSRVDLEEKFGSPFVKSFVLKSVLQNSNLWLNRYLILVDRKGSGQDNTEEAKELRLSVTSATYLKKMQELCDEYGVSLILRASPLMDDETRDDVTGLAQNALELGVNDIVSEYIQGIRYYPKEWFADGVHLTREALAQYGDMLRAERIP